MTKVLKQISQKIDGKKLRVNLSGQKWDTIMRVRQYENKRPAITLEDALDGCPFGTLTVNLPEVNVKDNEIIVKTWSENENLSSAALSCGLFRDTGKREPTGWVEASIWEVL